MEHVEKAEETLVEELVETKSERDLSLIESKLQILRKLKAE